MLASTETGCVIALGDSLTDANISTHDAYCRWPDQLARRLIARQNGRPLAVMNQGLGGNRILHDVLGVRLSTLGRMMYGGVDPRGDRPMPEYRYDHIHLRSADPNATARFFETMFGAEVTRDIYPPGTLYPGQMRVRMKVGDRPC